MDPPKYSRSLSLDDPKIRPKSPKTANKVVKVAIERDRAELVMQDYFYMTDAASMQNGLRVFDSFLSEHVVLYALNQLSMDREYITENGIMLVRKTATMAKLGGKAEVPIDPKEIVSSTTILHVLTQPHPETYMSDSLARSVWLTERVVDFLGTRLKEERQATAETTSVETKPVSIDVSSHIGNITEAIVGVQLKANHVDSAAKFSSLKAPEGTNLALSVSFSVHDKVKGFKLGTLSGSMKLILDNILDKVKDRVPNFLGYNISIVKDENNKPELLRLSAFFTTTFLGAPESLELLRQLELNLGFGKSDTADQTSAQEAKGSDSDSSSDEEEEPSHSEPATELFPPIDKAAAIFSAVLDIDPIALNLLQRVFKSSTWAPFVDQYASIALLVKRLSVALNWRNFDELTRHDLGNQVLQQYTQLKEVAGAILLTIENMTKQRIATSFQQIPGDMKETIEKQYSKTLKLIKECLKEIKSIDCQYSSLCTSMTFTGINIFHAVPSLEEITEIQSTMKDLDEKGPAVTPSNSKDSLFPEDKFADFVALAHNQSEKVWKRVTSKKTVKVFKSADKTEKKSSVKTTKVEGICRGVTPQQAFDTIYNVQTRRQWDDYITDLRLLDEFPQTHSRVLLVRYWVPPGVAPRDFVEFQHYKKFPDGSIAMLSQSCNHDDAPPRDGHIRGRVLFGGLLFEPIIDENGGTSTRCTIVGRNDYGGKLHSALIKLLNRIALINWMILFTKISSQRSLNQK